MQLTDEDRAAIEIAGKSAGDIRTHLTEAYRAGMRAGMERAAKVCEDYSASEWARYKRGDRMDPNSGRADPHTQGMSCGADICADAIRAAKE